MFIMVINSTIRIMETILANVNLQRVHAEIANNEPKNDDY